MAPPLLKSKPLAPDEAGVLIDVTPRKARWDFIHFTVRRITGHDERLP